MRFHLIFIFSTALGMMVARADPAIPEVLYRAPNEAIIEKWAHGRGTGSRIERIKADGKQILVALVDSCFGLTCESIYYLVGGIDYTFSQKEGGNEDFILADVR